MPSRKLASADGCLRDRGFRPQEPMGLWGKADYARRELAKHDQLLEIWWNESLGCWRVVEWVEAWGRWTWCFDWNGPNGEYREPVARALLAKLDSIDWTKYGQKDSDATVDQIHDDIAGPGERARDAAKKERHEATMALVDDLQERILGVRQTFGPGALRSRKYVVNEDVDGQVRPDD